MSVETRLDHYSKKYLEKFPEYNIQNNTDSNIKLIYSLLLNEYEDDVERLITYTKDNPAFNNSP